MDEKFCLQAFIASKHACSNILRDIVGRIHESIKHGLARNYSSQDGAHSILIGNRNLATQQIRNDDQLGLSARIEYFSLSLSLSCDLGAYRSITSIPLPRVIDLSPFLLLRLGSSSSSIVFLGHPINTGARKTADRGTRMEVGVGPN